MSGYTVRGDSAGSRTAEQVRWSNYYLTRDLEQAGPALHLLGRADRVPVVEALNGGASSMDSTVVDAVLPVALPVNTPHHPVDTRSKREQRDNKKRYGKAKAYYGKTYIVPRTQMIWAGVIGFGLSLMTGSAGALAVLHSFN